MLRSNLGILLAKTGKLASARQHALKAAELLPHNAGKWAQLAIILGQLGEREAAMSMYRKALALKPDDVWVRHSLATELLKRQRVDDSMRCQMITFAPPKGSPKRFHWRRVGPTFGST